MPSKGEGLYFMHGRSYGRTEEAFRELKAKCEYLKDGKCTYTHKLVCDSISCPNIIRRN